MENKEPPKIKVGQLKKRRIRIDGKTQEEEWREGFDNKSKDEELKDRQRARARRLGLRSKHDQ